MSNARKHFSQHCPEDGGVRPVIVTATYKSNEFYGQRLLDLICIREVTRQNQGPKTGVLIEGFCGFSQILKVKCLDITLK